MTVPTPSPSCSCSYSFSFLFLFLFNLPSLTACSNWRRGERLKRKKKEKDLGAEQTPARWPAGKALAKVGRPHPA
jgi:hypothetical protein